MIIPVSAEIMTINPGATVYIGESGLNITGAMQNNNSIGWWAASADIYHSSLTRRIDVSSSKNSFFVNPADFVGFPGIWYRLNTSDYPEGVAFYVADPVIDLKIWDYTRNTDISGTTTNAGTLLTFRIVTNQYDALNPSYRPNVDPVSDGFITIKVSNGSGANFTQLYKTTTYPVSLLNQNVSFQPWFWGNGSLSNEIYWATGLADTTGNRLYPDGIYTVIAESNLNGLKSNYRMGGADYTGKTVSAAQTITLVSVNFTAAPLSGKAPLLVQFTDTSTIQPASWNWSFGDNSTVNATIQNPVHRYISGGNYTVSLNVTTNSGFATVTKTGFINITNSTTKIGIFQNGGWYLDTLGTGSASAATYHFFGGAGWTNVSGDWNGDGKTEIGIYHDGAWYLDLAGTGSASTATYHYFGAPGWSPVVGDWNSDGKTEIGIYHDGAWYLDLAGTGSASTATYHYFGAPGWEPQVGKWS